MVVSTVNPRKLTPRVKRFLLHLESDALLDPISAARLAGYTRPQQSSTHLVRTWADKIAEVEDRLRKRARLSAEDVVNRLSIVGDNIEHKDHVRALETLARIHGLLTDKVSIQVSRGDISSQLGHALNRLERAETPGPSAIPLAIGDGSES